MKRIHYPDCAGGARCPACREGAPECYCRRCQSAAPFGLPPVSCLDLNRELFNRR